MTDTDKQLATLAEGIKKFLNNNGQFVRDNQVKCSIEGDYLSITTPRVSESVFKAHVNKSPKHPAAKHNR